MDIGQCSILLTKKIFAWCKERDIEIFVAAGFIFFHSEEDKIECWMVWAAEISEDRAKWQDYILKV